MYRPEGSWCAELFSDSMLIGDNAQANTFHIQGAEQHAKVEHGFYFKIGEDQLFYFWQGISAEDAISVMISGFCKDVFNQPSMEFAVVLKTGC